MLSNFESQVDFSKLKYFELLILPEFLQHVWQPVLVVKDYLLATIQCESLRLYIIGLY